MVEFVRTLTFRTHDLGVDATLVFTFNDDNIPGIYENVFPTAFMYAHSSFLPQRIEVILDQELPSSGRQVLL